MNFKQLVFRNVYRNRRTYATYFLSSLFSVMVFFIFALLYFHPQLAGTISSSSYTVSFLARMGMIVSQIVIVVMSVAFLGYTFVIFLKARKRDFSVYLMLGMREKDLKKMIVSENLIVGVSSIIIGLGIGLGFSKLILLITQNLLSIDTGLAFYLPLKPILLTSACFGILFLLISLVTTLKLQTESLVELTKTVEKSKQEPITKPFLVISSLILLLTGYGGVYLFASGWLYLQLLIASVLLTIIGTFLLFHQISIWLLKRLRKQNLFFKQGNMVTISQLIFRMRENATMYFLITIAASVAFVGIATTMVMGSGDFASTQEIQFAYAYQGMHGGKQYNLERDQKNIEEITTIIQAGGFEPNIASIESLYLGLPQTQQIDRLFGSSDWQVISLSQYEKIANEMKLPQISLENDREVYLLSSSNSDIKQTKSQSKEKRSETVKVRYGDGRGSKEMSVLKIPETLLYGPSFVGIVSDHFFNEIQEVEQQKIVETKNQSERYGGTLTSSTIIHFSEWQKSGAVDLKIREFQEKLSKENRELWEKIRDKDLDTVPIEEQPSDFYLISLYQIWQETRQANGLIVMISVLLGSVFFSFAACVLTFRLFGELNQDGKQQRSLYILGVPKKVREESASKELFVMYFIPIIVATGHFGVAMISLRKLSGFPTGMIFFKIVCTYLIFQVVFFIISRAFYLKHLTRFAEKN